MSLTSEQFNKLVHKKEFTEFKGEMLEMKDDVKSLLTAIDGLTKKVDDIEHAFVSNQAAHDRFEKRIARIEEHLKLNPYFV